MARFHQIFLVLSLLLLSLTLCHAQRDQDYPDPAGDTTLPEDMGVPPDQLDQYTDPNAFNEGETAPTDAVPGEDAIPGENAQDPFLPPEDAYLPDDTTTPVDEQQPADEPAPGDIPTETTTAPGDIPSDTTTAPEDIPSDTPPVEDATQPTDTATAAFAPDTTDANFDPDAATPADATVPTESATVAVDDTVTAGNGTMYDFQGAYEKMKGGDLSTEAIIGIVAGVCGGMVLVMCCACICWIRQRNIWRAKYGDGNAGAIEM
ncbi:unnamed protein product [Closterium sp. Yama58-4]|nr:unnamed protein product [Closterium sp. Yama58-4]